MTGRQHGSDPESDGITRDTDPFGIPEVRRASDEGTPDEGTPDVLESFEGGETLGTVSPLQDSSADVHDEMFSGHLTTSTSRPTPKPATPPVAAGEHFLGSGGRSRREEQPPPAGRKSKRLPSTRVRLRDVPRHGRVRIEGGSQLHLLVLACTEEDTTAIDLSSGALVRLRVAWPEGHSPDLEAFEMVEATLADDPERDDLAQPEASSTIGLPRQVGTLRGRRVRRILRKLAAPADSPLLGFPGSARPYWEFRGMRQSSVLLKPTRGPQLIRRPTDGSTWVRFGWEREDVWLPVEDRHAARALDAARRKRLSANDLATALGFEPEYLLVSLSRPRDGHCYKICTAILPRG